MHVNTLHIYERLKKAKSFEAQAREVADIIGNLVTDQLATKIDLKNTELMLKNDLEKTKLEIKAEVESKVEKAKLELKADIAQSKSETIKWVAGLLLAQAGLITALGKLL